MLKFIRNILFISIITCLYSCQPKVYTILYESLPTNDIPDSVLIYKNKQDIKNDYLVIGNTAIKATNALKPCQAVLLQKTMEKEVINAGGNAILLNTGNESHKLDSCKYMSAIILNIDYEKPIPSDSYYTSISDDRLKKYNADFKQVFLKHIHNLEFGFTGGLTYQIGTKPNRTKGNEVEYYNELRLGSIYGAILTYYPSNKLGIRLQANKQVYSNTAENPSTRFTYLSHKIETKFIGLNVVSRIYSKNMKSFVAVGGGMGILSYTKTISHQEKHGVYIAPMEKITENEIAPTINLGISYDHKILEKLSLGALLDVNIFLGEEDYPKTVGLTRLTGQFALKYLIY